MHNTQMVKGEKMYRFIVQDSETGTKIEECDSFREAQDIILAFDLNEGAEMG